MSDVITICGGHLKTRPPYIWSTTTGVPRENLGWNKLDSSMLKSKNQVTLFITIVTIVSTTFVFLKMRTEGYVPKYEIFKFYVGVICGHTFNISMDWSTYLYTSPMVIALVLAKFTCQKSLQTINYSSVGKVYCNIK